MKQPMFKDLEHDGQAFREHSETDSVDGVTRTLAAVNALLQQQQALEEKISSCVDFQQAVLNAMHHLSIHLGNNAMLAECAPKSTVPHQHCAADDTCGTCTYTAHPVRASTAPVATARVSSPDGDKRRSAQDMRRLSWAALRAERKKRAMDKTAANYGTRATDSCDIGDLIGDRRQMSKLFRRLVHDQRFDLFFGFIIVLNAVCLGIQVHIKATGTVNSTGLDVLDMLENVFSGFFLVELICRILAAGLPFFYNQDWTWNLFDFLVVASSLIEFFARVSNLGSADDFYDFSIIRVIRAIRIVRVLRVLRLFSFFRPLRILVYAIAHTLRQCFWALMLLFLLLFVFGIVFCQVATDYKQKCDRDETSGCKNTAKSLDEHYRTLSRTFGTLFMAVTGGIDWKGASLALLDISWVYCLGFVCYISFVFFAMMNVVTGLFCQTALESVQADTDNVIAEKLKQKDAYTSTLKHLCYEIDESGDGLISIDEFTALADDARLNSVLKSIDIDVEDAWLLFELLDVKEAGVIEIDDFVDGCLRLKGQAKGVHIHQLLYENKWIMAQLSDINHALHLRQTRNQALGHSQPNARPTAQSIVNAD